jgi:hypothetical protein
VADVLPDHVVLELEAVDRMDLNVYVPHLQMVAVVPMRRAADHRSSTVISINPDQSLPGWAL